MQYRQGFFRNFRACFRAQGRLLWLNKGFWIAFGCNLIFGLLSFIGQCLQYAGQDVLDVPGGWSVVAFSALSNWNLLRPFQPFLWVLPFAATAISEEKSGSLALAAVRADYRGYFFAKAAVSALANFTATVLPFAVNFLLCMLFFPHNRNSVLGIYGMPSYAQTLTGSSLLYATSQPAVPFLRLFLASPALYDFVFLLLLGGLAGVFGFWLAAIGSQIRRYPALLFLPPFVLVSALNTLSTRSFSAVIAKGSGLYRNLDLLDYCVPFSFPGKDWPYFWGMTALLLGSGVLLLELAVFRHQKTGALR